MYVFKDADVEEFDIFKYPFRNLFYSNYMFMVYLIGKDARNINYIMLNDRDEVNKIVDIYLNKYKRNTFDVKNYLGSDGYLNPVLVENKHMLSYFIRNNNSIFKYINFNNVSLGNAIVEVILKEASKRDFEFDNWHRWKVGYFKGETTNKRFPYTVMVNGDSIECSDCLAYTDSTKMLEGFCTSHISKQWQLDTVIKGIKELK